jgi:phosphoribosylformylglycinamidine synthase
MLWELEIRPRFSNPDLDRVRADFDLLTHAQAGADVIRSATRGYLLDADLTTEIDRVRLTDLLTDPLAEDAALDRLNSAAADAPGCRRLTVLLKPGVMDPVAQSILAAARDALLAVRAVRTFRRYDVAEAALARHRDLLTRRVLANDAIERVIEGRMPEGPLHVGRPYEFRRVVVPLRTLADAELDALSRQGQLALSLEEMRAIQAHFRDLGRDPTDVELETLAQTWSEHCSHKTLKGRITLSGRTYDNLLKETIFAATQEVRRRLGDGDWCVSVFEDNAGVIRFDDDHDICFKVETHNRPSAIEPYGGANTGVGGVIRDILGVGLGARPIANTDVFCFAPPDTPPEALPPGVLHPRMVMHGVVAGVRDYGNRVGVPTVNGAVVFDERYLANPLVFCGTVGLMPRGFERKQARAGDRIVAVGGRTGRDGIHGATFSSLGLSADSDEVSGGAVQIGNAIDEKKMLGAGGFSSAIGEMGAALGADVHLDRAPLKYDGLSYTEIWISEAQERMILAVPPEHWPELEALCRSEGVEATDLGEFTGNGRLRLFYREELVGELSMRFLHGGRPKVVKVSRDAQRRAPLRVAANKTPRETLLVLLASPTIASKEWIIRQYDHEVQGGSVVKPLVGVRDDGPGDAAVITPVLGSTRGLAIGCGINPFLGDVDPYAMAAAAIDEAVRNVVAVGADPERIALLDNFCWGDVNDPENLGALVRACEACRDVAIAFGMPFISGKDSLNNEYRSGDRHIRIPGTLLISAIGVVPDVRQSVTMDLKMPGNRMYLVGSMRDDFAGSQYARLDPAFSARGIPEVDLETAPKLFRALHAAIRAGLVRSCHDVSDGGLLVAAAEMALAGEVGIDLRERLISASTSAWAETLPYAESPTCWLVEVEPQNEDAFRTLFQNLPVALLGVTTVEPILRWSNDLEWPIADLKAAWQSAKQ